MLAIAGQTAGPNSGTLGVIKAEKSSLKIRNFTFHNSKFVFFQKQCQVLQRVYVIPGAKCAEFHLFLPSC